MYTIWYVVASHNYSLSKQLSRRSSTNAKLLMNTLVSITMYKSYNRKKYIQLFFNTANYEKILYEFQSSFQVP